VTSVFNIIKIEPGHVVSRNSMRRLVLLQAEHKSVNTSR
jgi:hypothetical protein